ncbi:MAG: uracil-DNA glycosylase [Bacteroidota bacterium]
MSKIIEPEINKEWLEILNEEFQKPYFLELKSFLLEEKKNNVIYPPGNQIFSAFNHTPFSKLNVVIIGQDPYHGEGQANGLCFSISKGIRKPPSLQNIFKEIRDDLGIEIPDNGNLEHWADQGILLLNATLTVRANAAGSHQNKGWEIFTDSVIKKISERKTGVVFLLWGNFAMKKSDLIDEEKHFILKAPHPSPLARGGFFGCKHFSITNKILEEQGKKPIDWSVK